MKAVKTTIAGALLIGAVYSLDYFLPEEKEKSVRRDCVVVYDRNGDVYVHSNPENMLEYLSKENPEELKKAYLNLERRLK